MLIQLWLPIVLSAVALFFASFLSWMVVQLHRKDWLKLPKEDEFLDAVRKLDVPPGSYMFPVIRHNALFHNSLHYGVFDFVAHLQR